MDLYPFYPMSILIMRSPSYFPTFKNDMIIVLIAYGFSSYDECFIVMDIKGYLCMKFFKKRFQLHNKWQ